MNLHDALHWFESICHEDNKTVVIVRKGDSLRALAKALSPTHSEEAWTDLRDANPNRSFDENYTIQPGEMLVLPQAWFYEK